MIYGIFDKKAEAFIMIFEADNEDLAKRSVFRMLENNNTSDLVKFPMDFSVHELCHYNNKDGHVHNSLNQPRMVFELFSLFRKSEDIPFGDDESEVKDDIS